MRIEPRQLPETLPFLGDLPPLLTRLYAARGVQSEAELDKSLARLIPFQQLKGIDAAVDLLVTALEQRQRILIVGDFDADGATASTVGMLGLRLLGAAHVDYLVPNRFEYGYGLTPEIVEVAMSREPHLLVTVDNGISSVEGVAAAKRHGLKVLITDHHLPGDELPLADALVNPNQPGCEFPSKALAGVGVIFYVLMALRARLRSLGWYENKPQPNIGELLDLVALGSVADVVPLDANNRILVHQGLERIRAGRARPGIKAILEVAKRDAARITSTDLGFIVGPRLNAAGRLDDMSLGIECLLTADANLAREMAAQLDGMNQDRKSIEQGMQREALAQLKDLPVESMPFGLPVRSGVAPGCDRHPRFTHERTLFPSDHCLRRCWRWSAQGLGPLGSRFPHSRCLERGRSAAPQPDRQVRWPRNGRRSDLAAGEFSAVRRGL
jgi:single-stranded-DNA-specific exonuclease